MCRDREGLHWVRQIIPARRITAIGRLGRHDPRKAITLRHFVAYKKKRRIDSQNVAGKAGQALDVKRMFARLRVGRDAENLVRPEDENISPVRFQEIVAELVHENLVAGIDGATGDDFALLVLVPRQDLEILAQGIGRRVNEDILPLTFDARKGKKEPEFFRENLLDAIVLGGNDVDVIASEHKKLRHLPQNIWRRLVHGVANDAVKRRLHGTGWNFERLQEIGPDAD